VERGHRAPGASAQRRQRDLRRRAPFSGEERHQRRIDLVARYETTGGYAEDRGAGDDAR
jgi:ribose 5-phosphate isomerase B